MTFVRFCYFLAYIYFQICNIPRVSGQNNILHFRTIRHCENGYFLNRSLNEKTFPVSSAIQCGFACLQDKRCFAMNVCLAPKPCSKKWKYTCEIIERTTGNACTDLTPASNCNFHEVVDPCGPGAVFKDNICICLNGTTSDRCDRLIRDCTEGHQLGVRQNGVYHVQPFGAPAPFLVRCHMKLIGYTYIHHRTIFDCSNPSFYRTWKDYKDGFGEKFCNFWLGNEHIHEITRQGKYWLEVFICPLPYPPLAYKFYRVYYEDFSVDSELDEYRVHLTHDAGQTAGDSLTPSSNPAVDINGKKFSTFDRDNGGMGCPRQMKSGWWFAAGCTAANLNGVLKSFGWNDRLVSWDYDFAGRDFAGMYLQLRAEYYYK